MIITEFAKFLQSKEEEIIEKKSCVALLGAWVKSVLESPPKTNVEKVIHAEISIAKNNNGNYLLIAKSESGRSLTSSLYNFALSFEQHVMTKWLQDKTPKDFETGS